jgi:hypothetical protein
MSRVISAPYKLRSAYEAFLEAFKIAVEDANREVIFSTVPLNACFTDPGDPENVDFKTFLHLKDWPCRKLEKGRRLDVVIKALERFKRPEWRLTKSTVYLNYILVSDSKSELVQSLHYDFDEGGQPAHPFFHLQLNVEPIPQDELVDSGFDIEFSLPAPAPECWVTTRIPTSDMTFASVLYCLMADHLGTDTTGIGAGIFAQFNETVSKLQDRLPPLSFNALRQSVQRSSDFKSSHWFAHMF